MLCDRCGKNKATVRYEENINGERKKINLCNECSKHLGILNMNFMDNMFMSFLNEPSHYEIDKMKEDKCSKCGYTFSDYAKSGLLGCADCYSTFNDKLETILHKIHGKSYHLDINQRKDTNKDDIDSNVEVLKQKLKECIEKEEYEKAAIIRDEIKKLNQRGDK